MRVQESNYIWPPRAKASIPFEDAELLYTDLEWIAQFKYNDSRCLIKILENGDIELWNRHGEKFRNYNPPPWLIQQLSDVASLFNLEGYCLLDGGLLDQKHRAIKDTIVIWDILVRNGEHLLDTTYRERYDMLWQYSPSSQAQKSRLRFQPRWDQAPNAWNWRDNLFEMEPFPFGERLNTNVFMPRNIYPKDWAAAWDMIQRINQPFVEADPPIGPLLEGFMFKNPHGRLEMAWKQSNNESWQARSRVTTGRHAF